VAPATKEPLKVKFEPVIVMLPPELNVAAGLKRNPEAFVPVVKPTVPAEFAGTPKPDSPLMPVSMEFERVKVVRAELEISEPLLLKNVTESAKAATDANTITDRVKNPVRFSFPLIFIFLPPTIRLQNRSCCQEASAKLSFEVCR
jgi:hypothetical protein